MHLVCEDAEEIFDLIVKKFPEAYSQIDIDCREFEAEVILPNNLIIRVEVDYWGDYDEEDEDEDIPDDCFDPDDDMIAIFVEKNGNAIQVSMNKIKELLLLEIKKDLMNLINGDNKFFHSFPN